MKNVQEIDPSRFARCLSNGEPYALLTLKAKVTWRCNLSCRQCSYWQRAGFPELPTSVWLETIADAAALGCQKVHFSGGEPLMRKDLELMVSAAAARGMRVNLTTNGTLMTPARAESLVGAGISTVTFSIDSPRRKIHDQMRGTGAWRATITGAKCLRRAGKERGARVRLRINTVLSRTTYLHTATLPQLASRLRAKGVLLIPIDDPAGQGWRLNKSQIAAFNATEAPRLTSPVITSNHPFGTSPRAIELSSRGLYAQGEYDLAACLVPWFHSFVLPSGDVLPCCMRHGFGPVFGNLSRTPLSSIWQSSRYQEFRQHLLAARGEEPCTRCDDFLMENRALRLAVGL